MLLQAETNTKALTNTTLNHKQNARSIFYMVFVVYFMLDCECSSIWNIKMQVDFYVFNEVPI